MDKEVRTVDEYIARFEPEIQIVLNELRNIVKSEAPEASEKISYGMPTFYLNGNLVHFAAFKHHYGFFPAPSAIDEFEEELAPYRSGKGSLHFPMNKPIPQDIIKKIVRFRVNENLNKTKSRKTKK
ncbi:MAG: DUF1801 domain-containing protein [Prevotellaceae bacterium]|jgi:uncharacterized protein YdhG (YjbR/CyaY superfamily)|nr:DUF1801 domain-containing protein [Prevotellaceae bacterium]